MRKKGKKEKKGAVTAETRPKGFHSEMRTQKVLCVSTLKIEPILDGHFHFLLDTKVHKFITHYQAKIGILSKFTVLMVAN